MKSGMVLAGICPAACAETCAAPQGLCVSGAGVLGAKSTTPCLGGLFRWPFSCQGIWRIRCFRQKGWQVSLVRPRMRCLVSDFFFSDAFLENDRNQIDQEDRSGVALQVVHDEEGAEMPTTLRQVCAGQVPEQLLQRAEEVGYKYTTPVQSKVLPVLLSGRDCIVHAQTGSGKTLAYLLPLLSKVNPSRAAVQALVLVPTRELGMQVAKVARTLAGRPMGEVTMGPGEKKDKTVISVMALLDGGSTSRQKTWLKADPPHLIVGTLPALSRMIAINALRPNSISCVVVDEVDAMIGAAKEGGLLGKLLTVHTTSAKRQTMFASATIPQHNRFVRDCIHNKWTKEDLIHLHLSPDVKMPPYLLHRYVISSKPSKLETLAALLATDRPTAAIIFVNEPSEKARRAGDAPMTATVADFLSETREDRADAARWEPLILEEDANINARTCSLAEFREGRCLLVATDIAARGLDLPEVSHIYNLDLPANVTDYVHRAGRTARRPLEQQPGTVTSIITEKERFVVERMQNELLLRFNQLDAGT